MKRLSRGHLLKINSPHLRSKNACHMPLFGLAGGLRRTPLSRAGTGLCSLRGRLGIQRQYLSKFFHFLLACFPPTLYLSSRSPSRGGGGVEIFHLPAVRSRYS